MARGIYSRAFLVSDMEFLAAIRRIDNRVVWAYLLAARLQIKDHSEEIRRLPAYFSHRLQLWHHSELTRDMVPAN
jgi:hypothetical protein